MINIPTKEEKAFYWNCDVCSGKLTEADNITFVYRGVMSGNTPVLGRAETYHETCYDAVILGKGEE